jgi:hypothetical protein
MIMNQSDELRGTMVLIHPDLTNDPAGMPNQIGVITGTEMEYDNVFVGFGKSGQALYSMDAVLILKNAGSIFRDLAEHKTDLNVNDYQALYTIALLQDREPSPANQLKALDLARNSATVRDLSTESIEKARGLHVMQNQFIER